MHTVHRGIWLGAASLVALGCMGKRESFVAAASPDEAVGQLDAAPDNSILAVGGTLQLSLSALSLTGIPLTTFDSTAYRLTTAGDSTRVRVTSSGLVTGLVVTGAPVAVNVLAFRSGTWNGDQLLVTVTATATPGLMLSIQPGPGDSTKLATGTAKTITPLLQNSTTGQSLTGIQLQYAVQPADAERVGVFTGFVRIRDVFNAGAVHLSPQPAATKNQIIPYVGEGAAWIYANVNAYGTLLRDSVRYTFSYPYTGSVSTSKNNLAVLTSINAGIGTAAMNNPSAILAPGAIVTFSNDAPFGDPLTVAYAFDNPAAATAAVPASSTGGASGNVSTLTTGQSSARQFLTPGTYRWTRVASGGPAPWAGQTTTGSIVIK